MIFEAAMIFPPSDGPPQHTDPTTGAVIMIVFIAVMIWALAHK